MKIYLESFTQLKIVMCLLNHSKLNVYDLMKLTKLAKTTIIDNINRINYVITIGKQKIKLDDIENSLTNIGRPITYFFILDDFKTKNTILLRINGVKYHEVVKPIVHTIIMNKLRGYNYIEKQKDNKKNKKITPFKETLKILKDNKEKDKDKLVHQKFINEE